MLPAAILHAFAFVLLATRPAAAAPRTVPDSAAAPAKIVRQFPAVEVRSPLHDLRSAQVVHAVREDVLHSLPADGLAGVVALQPGVVAQGGELHVRGGRAGETAMVLDGVSLLEPLRGSATSVPLAALRAAELASGAPDARDAATLAGVLTLRPSDPGARPSGEWSWQGSGEREHRFDRASARISAPLPATGWGVIAAGEGTFDDTWMPRLRSRSGSTVLGVPLGWRARNDAALSLRLAPVANPRRTSLQLLAGRSVREPFDPQWSVDGYVFVPANPKLPPVYSDVPLPGYARYRAADHLAITDDRRLAAIATGELPFAPLRTLVTLGWLRDRTVTATGGTRGVEGRITRPRYLNPEDVDLLHVFWGDDPYVRQADTDTWTLRADGVRATRTNGLLQAGLGTTYEAVAVRSTDWFATGWSQNGDPLMVPIDTVRAFRAFAPGGFAYVQDRWEHAGMILDVGLRLDLWTAGPQADRQSLPADGRVLATWSPRFAVAYPVSVRDVFTLAYARVHQAPPRDLLYDSRTVASNREPLGNPALEPATAIGVDAALKHLLSATSAIQLAVFVRDVYGQPGARLVRAGSGPANLRYVGEDEGQAVGGEAEFVRDDGDGRRVSLSWTWMQAWGNESRSAGDPYGVLRESRSTLRADTPLSWDQRHTLRAHAAWRARGGWAFAWTTQASSALPWTPKPLRAPQTDAGAIDSRRLDTFEATDVDVRWAPKRARGWELSCSIRNLFDHRGESLATVDGYPNPYVNTTYDDYGAHRTLTGRGGGGWWVVPSLGSPYWIDVHDPRLSNPPRAVRFGLATRW